MGLAVIPILGIDNTYRTPGAYAEILFGQGPATASAGVRSIVFAMPMISTGTWTAGVLYPVNNEAEVIAGAGAGSPLHRGMRIALLANNNAKYFALPVAETSGGSPIAATAVLTIASTSTGVGTLTVTIAGEDCQYTFASGTTATLIGDGIVLAINAKTWLPVTAVNASGTVTLTAKLKGISQGTATVPAIRVRSLITAGVATAATFGGAFLGTGAAGVEGSATEASNLSAALANINSVRKYYICSSAIDATSLTNINLHVSTKSQPKQGLRSVAVTAWVGSLAAGQTLAVAKNYERLQIAFQRNSEHDPAEVAGNMVAIRQKREAFDTAFNFAGYSGTDWLIKPAYSSADWLSGDEQNTAINDGLTPIASTDGDSYIVMSVNTRSKNSTGAVADFRACETHRISVSDEFADELLANTVLNFQGKKLVDDEFLADGTINGNARIIRDVVRPSYLRPPISKQFDDYESAGKIQNAASSKASLRLVKSPANSSRVECGYDLRAVDHAHQFTFRAAEVSPG